MQRVVALLAGLSLATVAAVAEEPPTTGAIRGRVTYGGKPPALPRNVGRRPGVVDESLVVEPKSRGVANVFVYLRKTPVGMPAAVGVVPREPVRVSLRGDRFEPHASLVRTGQPVLCVNADPRDHNVHVFPIKNPAVTCLLPPRANEQRFVYNVPEILPIQVKDDISAWMSAYWLILDHPYAAITDSKGSFEIKGLPPSRHSFRVWHERAGYLDKSLEVEVKAGETTDVGTRSFPPSEFE